MRRHSCDIELDSEDASFAGFLIVVSALIGVQVVILYLVGRQWICSCGDVQLWQHTLDPGHNSQHLSDPYSMLHMVFGMGLLLWLRWIRPGWTAFDQAKVAACSSVIWEAVENIPFIVRRFGAEGTQLHYVGDSILNSVSDTIFVMAGFALTSRMPFGLSVAIALALELTVYLLIGDGILIGGRKLLTGM